MININKLYETHHQDNNYKNALIMFFIVFFIWLFYV